MAPLPMTIDIDQSFEVTALCPYCEQPHPLDVFDRHLCPAGSPSTEHPGGTLAAAAAGLRGAIAAPAG